MKAEEIRIGNYTKYKGTPVKFEIDAANVIALPLPEKKYIDEIQKEIDKTREAIDASNLTETYLHPYKYGLEKALEIIKKNETT